MIPLQRTMKNKKLWAVLLPTLVLLVLMCIATSRFSISGPSDNGQGFAVHFTEILTSNSLYPDREGEFRDFVEIYNSADGPIDISGYHLTDNQRSVEYSIPKGTILQSGAYLTIWCEKDYDGKDPFVAPFSLNRGGGETVYLINSKNVIVDSVITLPSKQNFPMVLAGGSSWSVESFATPGFPNTRTGYSEYMNSRSASSFPVHLSEILSSNSLYRAEDGNYYDFVELMNYSDNTVDISGCRLSDDPSRIKYIFPDGTVLAPGEIMLLWSQELSFRISSEGGEELSLQSPSGEVIDSIIVPYMDANVSYARLPDGSWEMTEAVTPGFDNSAEGISVWQASEGLDELTLLISEVQSSNRSSLQIGNDFPDWIEIHNFGSETVDLSGCWLSDDLTDPFKWCFPTSTLEKDGYLVLLCDGLDCVDESGIHTSFQLARTGEDLILSSPSGSAIDTLKIPEMESDLSAVRSSDTDRTSSLFVTPMPTPSLANTEESYLALQDRWMPSGCLCINEVMSSNDRYLPQSDGEYYDWVEIKNISDHDVDLSGYALSDDIQSLRSLSLSSAVLEPDSVFTIVLKDAPFGLNAQEDWLYLYDPEGNIIDCIHLHDMPYQHSMGRMDEAGGYYYFSNPTPDTDNGTAGSRLISDAPLASCAPGVYDQIDQLTVELSSDGTIYYTTDGSWPTMNSEVYTRPFELSKTTVIRAISVSEGRLPSETTSLTYLINEDLPFPAVSITCDPADLWNESDGIYANYYADLEKHANITFYDDKGPGFNLDCGLKLFGSISREYSFKKNLKIVFRPTYGCDSLNYDLYGSDYIQNFSALVLRTGQDFTAANMREELMTSLAKEASESLQTQATRPCILFLNGEYWGMYNLKECFNEDYYASHYQVPAETVTYTRVINLYYEAPDLYELMCFALSNDMTDPAVYAHLCEHIDIESLADWMIFQSYCANNDILNNVKYMKSEEDGLWRWCFYDLDWSFLDHWYTPVVFDEEQQSCFLPIAMVRNPEFRRYFLERLAYHLSSTLSNEYVLGRIDELQELLAPAMPRERDRWYGSYEGWLQEVDNLRYYITNGRNGEGRAIDMIDSFCSYLDVSEEEREEIFGGLE